MMKYQMDRSSEKRGHPRERGRLAPFGVISEQLSTTNWVSGAGLLDLRAALG